MESRVTVLGDSSDSSEEDSPVVKKNPCRSRGLARKLLRADVFDNAESVSEDAAIYSKRVEKFFSHPPQRVPSVSAGNKAADTCKSDHEAEEPIIVTRKSPRKTRSQTNSQSISLLDDDDDLQCTPPDALNVSNISARSPTPPPPPSPPKNVAVIPHKKPRMTKALKKALKNLSDTKDDLYVNDRIATLQNTSDCVILDNSIDDNMTLRIKCGTTTYRYSVEPKEPFKRVIADLSCKEDVTQSQILLVHNDATISTTDSPQCLGITPADIIECHIKRGNCTEWPTRLDDSPCLDDITVYIQTSDSRQKLEFKIDKKKPLYDLVNKYSVKKGVERSKVKLFLDGEEIDLNDSANDMEIENGDTLDIVNIK